MVRKLNFFQPKNIHQRGNFSYKKKNVDYIFSDGYTYIVGEYRVYLAKKVATLCVCMNGKTSEEGIRKKLKAGGIDFSPRDLKKTIHKLKKHGFLVNKKNGFLLSKLSKNYVEKLEKKFEKSKIRKPSYAGISYKINPKELEKDIQICFDSVDNSKLEPFTRNMGRIRGIIVPHSNIELSGPCAAWAYKALAGAPRPDLFVFFAPDHSGSLKYPFSVLLKDFRTPLGLVKVDRNFGSMLAKKNCDFDIFSDILAHFQEHAIEIQLPFLQYIYQRDMKKVKILPVLCADEPHTRALKSTYNAYRNKFLTVFQNTIYESGKNVVFVATGDLEHLRRRKPGFQFHRKNKKIINLLKKGEAKDFEHIRSGTCGSMSFYVFFKLLGSCKGKVLNYSWTSNSIKSYRQKNKYSWLINIGYVSMVFY